MHRRVSLGPRPSLPPPPPVPRGNRCAKASSGLCSGPPPCPRASWSYPTGAPCGPGAVPQARGRAARVPPTGCPCLPEGSAPAGAVSAVPERRLRESLPRVRSASAPRRSPLAGLATRPARAPGNASPTPFPTPAHDSGPVWWATHSRSEVLRPRTICRAADYHMPDLLGTEFLRHRRKADEGVDLSLGQQLY